jgi:hypothetical protein
MAKNKPRSKKVDTLGTHITAFVDNELKKDWDSYCESIDLNSSQLLRRLMKTELETQNWKARVSA